MHNENRRLKRIKGGRLRSRVELPGRLGAELRRGDPNGHPPPSLLGSGLARRSRSAEKGPSVFSTHRPVCSRPAAVAARWRRREAGKEHRGSSPPQPAAPLAAPDGASRPSLFGGLPAYLPTSEHLRVSAATAACQ